MRSPGVSGAVQARSTSRSGTGRGLTAIAPALISATSDGSSGDVAALLAHLPARDQAALTRLVSRLLTGYAAGRGIDLFAVGDPAGGG